MASRIYTDYALGAFEIQRINIEDYCYRIGVSAVERIEPYQELGEMGRILWFEVWFDDGSLTRVNGKYVREVHYGKN